jgi:hypothetical protein
MKLVCLFVCLLANQKTFKCQGLNVVTPYVFKHQLQLQYHARIKYKQIMLFYDAFIWRLQPLRIQEPSLHL